MINTMKRIHENRRGATPLTVLLLLAVILPIAGCEGLLDVQDVDVTSQDNFVDETALPAIHASVLDEYVGIYENLVLYTGLLADEWMSSGTFPTRVEIDRRDIDITNGTAEPLFSGVSRARATADFAEERFEAIDTARSEDALRSQVNAFGGLALVHMAETYCEGTPISRFDFETEQVTYGSQLTRAEVLDSARARIQAAQSFADAGSDEDYLGRIAMARVLLNEGDYPGAAAQVASIPTDWLFLGEHDAQSGQNNPIWSFNISQERWSVADMQGTNGLPFRSAADVRILWRRSPATDVGFDSDTPQFDLLKYMDRPAQTVIADGIEARLIEAEAALAADPTGATMLPILNELRQNVATLQPPRNYNFPVALEEAGFTNALADLAAPADNAAAVDMLFSERAFWLFAQAHRLSDMRRLIRQYGRAAESVFPTGAYYKGNVYATDVNFPIPNPEANNPESPDDAATAGLCLNRDA
jgi:hypothetical protein